MADKRKRRREGEFREVKEATEHLETSRGESETAPRKNRRQGEGDAGFRGGSKSAHMHPRVCPTRRERQLSVPGGGLR